MIEILLTGCKQAKQLVTLAMDEEAITQIRNIYGDILFEQITQPSRIKLRWEGA